MGDTLGIRSRLALLRQLPDVHPCNRSRRARAGEVAAWRTFDSRTVARLLGREHVLGIGDSHLAALSLVVIPGVWLRAFGIGGATASGIRNPASRTRAREIFDARLALAPRWQHLVIGLGEVDCGFLIWQRAKSHGFSVSEQVRDTVQRHASFVEDSLRAGFRSVSVLSVTLPTVADYRKVRANPILARRSAVNVGLRDRTELTLTYNDALAERCEATGATFFDTTDEQLDRATGLVSPELTVLDDPHLDLTRYAQILSRALDVPGAPWHAYPGGAFA